MSAPPPTSPDLDAFKHHWQDEADAAFLYDALVSVERDEQIVGGLLALITLLIFLRSLRSVAIAIRKASRANNRSVCPASRLEFRPVRHSSHVP